jgi:hypothetical protein
MWWLWSRNYHYEYQQDQMLAELNAQQQMSLDTDAAHKRRLEQLTRENIELKVYVASLVDLMRMKELITDEELATIVKRVEEISKKVSAA